MSESQAAALSDESTLHQPEQRTTPDDQGNRFRSTDPRRKSPFFAGVLSLMPGLGQVYVGYYRRGFTNVLTAGTVLSILVWAGGDVPFVPLGIIFLIFFELYNIIDAARRASLYNLSLDGIEQITLPDELSDSGISGISGSYLGGAALLLFGLIALSNTLFGLSLEWLESWWPLMPLGFGGYLVYKAYLDSQVENEGSEANG